MAESKTTPRTGDPRFSPSYPQRVHVRERAQWEALLATWQAKVSAQAERLASLRDRAAGEKLLAQMGGAVDQIGEATRRLPQEAGDLYEEDRHRLEEAVRSLERLFARWESL